jgi:hypothetical protein
MRATTASPLRAVEHPVQARVEDLLLLEVMIALDLPQLRAAELDGSTGIVDLALHDQKKGDDRPVLGAHHRCRAVLSTESDPRLELWKQQPLLEVRCDAAGHGRSR